MPTLALVFGSLLVFLGVGFSYATDNLGTALIPAYVGLLLIVLGFLAQRVPPARKHAMHFAALLGLLGTAGGLGMGVGKVVKIVQGENVERPLAAYEQVAMGVLCLIFFALCLKSFIDARRNRLAAPPPG
jgi:hypothetical protein